jgi:hypothetical protein
MFIIEDEAHAEWCGEFTTKEEAILELRARSLIPWNQEPNVCPCMSWRTCGREYFILEFNTSVEPWEERSRTPVLSVSSKEVKWEQSFTPHPLPPNA